MPLITPVAPSISSVTASSALITRNADGNPGGTFYSFQVTYSVGLDTIIQYIDSGGSFSPIPVWLNLSSLSVNELIPNTAFFIALAAATNGLGSGATPYGPSAPAVTLAAQPLFLPFSAIYSTEVTANWQANHNPQDTEFFVQLSTDPAFIFPTPLDSGWITDTSFIFTDLLPNTIYYGRVKARNSSLAETGYTNLGSVTTPAGPSTVMGTRSTNLLANRGFLIEWSANVEPNIALYRVYRSSSPTDNASFQVIATTPANVTSYVDNVPFTFGITWYYKVTALDNGNNESPIDLTSAVQDMSFHSFEEQPFPTQVNTSNIVNGEVPSGDINGINPLFTTTFPYRNGTLSIFLNGAKLTQYVDFTLSIPQQFVLNTAPVSGDFLRVDYLKF